MMSIWGIGDTRSDVIINEIIREVMPSSIRYGKQDSNVSNFQHVKRRCQDALTWR